MKNTRPAAGEYDVSLERYVSLVPETDILPALERQPAEWGAALATVSREREEFRYAPGKWTIRGVFGHVVDAERVFGYRTLAIGRGDRSPLPAFEEEEWAARSGHDRRTLASLLDEFTALRASHVHLIRNLDDEAWTARGTANGLPITPRALAYVLVGHARHHAGVLRTKYGVGAP